MQFHRISSLASLAVAACAASYSGSARTTTRAALEASPGWILAATPERRERAASDCGAAALAMIAARWGVDPPRAAAGDITFAQLRHAARALGLDAYEISASSLVLDHELRRGRPVVVALWRPYGDGLRRGHYEVVVGLNPETGEIATIDPGAGWRVRTLAQLELEWAPVAHPALVVLGTGTETSAR